MRVSKKSVIEFVGNVVLRLVVHDASEEGKITPFNRMKKMLPAGFITQSGFRINTKKEDYPSLMPFQYMFTAGYRG